MSERIYHVWFSTKERRAALEGEIDDDVRRLLRENALRAGVRLIETKTALDHLHLVLAVPENKPLSAVMHQIKGATSYAVFSKYPDLKRDMRSLWQKGYSFRRLEPDEVPATRLYVRTQQSRPFRHDYE